MVLFPALPLELHIEIWSYLDNPEQLSLTSQRLLDISRSKHVRLAYFLAKGPKHAIFAAICRPNIFDEELFKQLLARGAILPRNLVQELQVRFGLYGNDRYEMSRHAWSLRLKPLAVLAVLAEGHRQYPDWDMEASDNKTYLQCLEAENRMSNGTIKKLFEDHAFTLLPFSRSGGRLHMGSRYGERCCNVNLETSAPKAIKLEPSLARILYDSGQDIDMYSKRDIIEHYFNHAGKLGATTLTSSLRTLLEDDRLKYSVSEQMARRVVLGLKHVDQPTHYLDQDRLPISTSALAAWKALKTLDSEGLLKDIKLTQIIENLAETISKEPNSTEWRSLQSELCKDCPYVRIYFAKGRWLQEFTDHQASSSVAEPSDVFDAKKKWKKALTSVATIVSARKALCGAKVTPMDIIQVLMRTQMSTDMLPLLYAEAYLDVEDWKSFTIKLIRHLLCQVYKGRTLIALQEWFDCTGKVDFRRLLQQEIQRSDVVHEKDMPSMNWKLEFGKHWRYYVPETWEASSRRDKWQHPLGLAYHYESSSFLDQVLNYPERVPVDADPSTVFDKIGSLADRSYGGPMELRSFLQLQTTAAQPWTALSKESIETVIKSSLHNSLAVVQLCGPESAASRTAMKHAVMACTRSEYYDRSFDLVLELHKAGCEFTVWHVWALQKQGSPMPEKWFQELRFADLADPEHVWPTISKRGRVNRLSKHDVARITATPRLPQVAGERTLRIEYVDDIGLAPVVTCRSDKGKGSIKSCLHSSVSSPSSTKAEAESEDEHVPAADMDVSMEAGSTFDDDAQDDTSAMPVRSSSRIAAAAAAAAAADNGKGKEIETEDEELLVVTDWKPTRIQRSEAERQLRAGEKWLELFALLIGMDKMRRKVQARSFAQLNKGHSHASSTGSPSAFEKKTPILMARLERSLELLRECLRSGDDPGEEKVVLTQSLLRESLDAQNALQEDEVELYKILKTEMESEIESERGENSKRRRSSMPKRKCYTKARKSFPKDHGPPVPGDLSSDDEDFTPSNKEEDDVETSEDESTSSDEASAASPPPPRKRFRRGGK